MVLPVLAAAAVLRYVPAHDELKYTFGGAAPVRHIQPGTRIVSWTEDCFDGALTKPGQKPSEVLAPGHDNPQTGRSTSTAPSRGTRSRSASRSSSPRATTESPSHSPASAR